MSNRKLLLAHIRNGRYAHAGEEEAIDLTMTLIKKNPQHTLLDVGCGLGGTANYIEPQGFGKVIGIDVDKEVLEQAKTFYPNIPFYLCDANALYTFFKDQKFNVFYSFNAFFCFKDQTNCLKQFSEVAEKNAELLIFDYSSPKLFLGKSPFIDEKSESRSALLFSPIELSTIETTLNQTQWQLMNIINLNDKYKLWYRSLISKMKSEKLELIERFGKTTFDDLYTGYMRLMELLDKGIVGGSIIHAKHKD